MFKGLGRRHDTLTCQACGSSLMALSCSCVASSLLQMSLTFLNVNPFPYAMHFLRTVLWSVPKLVCPSLFRHVDP